MSYPDLTTEQVEQHLRDGWALIQTWHGGSFLLEKGKRRIHVFHSTVAPLFERQVIKPKSLVGTPPGGHWTYEVAGVTAANNPVE